jgi:anthranilate phosphoribosyltransferase
MTPAEALASVRSGGRLACAEARSVFGELLAGRASDALVGELLLALAARGESAEELAGAALAMRAAMRPFEHSHPAALDTAGTGGDGLGLFNLSTAAALVAAAAGAPVIKHGNRAASSRCGSADLLEAAGVRIDLEPRRSRELLDELGICFLFAPAYHPALARLAPLRRALGRRTAFNLLGPLCNPGLVQRQLLGVAHEDLLETMAEVLGELDSQCAFVVHGAGGADELTLCGANRIVAVGTPTAQGLEPRTHGLASAPLAALRGGDARENVGLLDSVLRAEAGALTDAVLLNATAALMVSGVRPAGAALERARAALESGAARELFGRWIDLSNRN